MTTATPTARSAPPLESGKPQPLPPEPSPTAALGPAEPAAALLGRLERLIGQGFAPMRADLEPLMDEVRQGLTALYPTAGGRQLAPPEQQDERARLAVTLDTLEDILEALQRAPRARRPGPSAGPRET
jgi:hypothetical protein